MAICRERPQWHSGVTTPFIKGLSIVNDRHQYRMHVENLSKPGQIATSAPHAADLNSNEGKLVARSTLSRNVLPHELYQIATFVTEIGWISLLGQQDLLCRVTFGHNSANESRRSILPVEIRTLEWQTPLIDRLTAYAAGNPQDFSQVSLLLDGFTTFAQRVLNLTRAIPKGAVLSYAELAQQAGHRGAARAVGSVMARNPVPLIVPCHRVVGSRGTLGGFSAIGGLETKRRLLQLESSLFETTP